MIAEQVVAIGLAALAAGFNALAFYILRLHWSEITELRKARHEHANTLTAHELRIDALERGFARE